MDASNHLSVLSLIIHADLLVQIVMLILLAASMFSWSVVFDKTIKLRKQRMQANIFEQSFNSGKVIDDLYHEWKNKKDNALVQIFVAGVTKRKRLKKTGECTEEVVETTVRQAIENECQNVISGFERNVDWLATIGSTAPFVGLLGTVWGIMNSFQSIGVNNNASIAIIAPSIAEALLATAAGLIVAIPAVIFYNRILVQIEAFSIRLKDFSVLLHTPLVKSLDE